jgi:hypothetical protein
MEELKCDICRIKIDNLKIVDGNKIGKFCDAKCRSKWVWRYARQYQQNNLHKWYIQNKSKVVNNNKLYKKNNPLKMKKINSALQLRNYYRNPRKKIENIWVYTHRKEFEKILGKICLSCKTDKEIFFHHKTYEQDKLPHTDFIEYAKQLIPLCRKCHREEHQKSITLK